MHDSPRENPAGRVALCAAVAVFFVAAFAVRAVDIAARPMHTDEAVNAFIVGETLSDVGYHYRPNDHHGPTLYFPVAGALRLAGISGVAGMEAWMLRIFPALAGALTVAGAFAFRRELGKTGVFASAALLAFAAPFAYYGAYFIHETLFIALTLTLFAALWRFRDTAGTPIALAGGVCAGLMFATKETAAPIALTMLAVTLPGGATPWRAKARGVAFAALAAIATTALFFSGFGRHRERLADLVEAARLMTARGLGDEHAHPFFTYLNWGFAPSPVGDPWCGWILAGLALAALALRPREHFVRATAAWALVIFLLQSALPYKTPWLMLSFLLPLALLAGRGAEALARHARIPRAASVCAALLAFAALCAETHTRCHTQAVNPSNPLAYSPSSPDLARLEHDMSALAAKPGNAGIPVRVVARDYWPLPWTLRKIVPTGFQSEPTPDVIAAPAFVISGPEHVAEYAERAPFESYEIRPGVFVFLSTFSNPAHPTNPSP